jgi:hypothetical protein
MEQAMITLENGRSVAFDVDLGLKGPAYFVLGVRKSGSTWLNAIAVEMSQVNRCRFIPVGDHLFFHNVAAIDWQYDSALQGILHPGNVYGGFRDMPFGFLGHPIFDNGLKILMVRDPRDALVSEYFSNAYSHPIPEATAKTADVTAVMTRLREKALKDGIDVYVIDRARELVKTIVEFGVVVKSSTTKVVKYEDYIFKKRELIELMAAHFAWSVDEESIERIVRQVDVRPEVEDPHAFVRKVTPGDHREKLRPATIVRLNKLLRAAMRLLDYPETA